MIHLYNESIVRADVDAIVTSANELLQGGLGVDFAIHCAEGEQLDVVCEAIGFCKTGHAVVTPAFHLKAKYIIHCVTPRYEFEDSLETLRITYRNVISLAKAFGCKTVAFPSMGTGAHKFPIQIATEIAVEEIKAAESSFESIHLYITNDDMFEVYKTLL